MDEEFVDDVDANDVTNNVPKETRQSVARSRDGMSQRTVVSAPQASRASSASSSSSPNDQSGGGRSAGLFSNLLGLVNKSQSTTIPQKKQTQPDTSNEDFLQDNVDLCLVFESGQVFLALEIPESYQAAYMIALTHNRNKQISNCYTNFYSARNEKYIYLNFVDVLYWTTFCQSCKVPANIGKIAPQAERMSVLDNWVMMNIITKPDRINEFQTQGSHVRVTRMPTSVAHIDNNSHPKLWWLLYAGHIRDAILQARVNNGRNVRSASAFSKVCEYHKSFTNKQASLFGFSSSVDTLSDDLGRYFKRVAIIPKKDTPLGLISSKFAKDFEDFNYEDISGVIDLLYGIVFEPFKFDMGEQTNVFHRVAAVSIARITFLFHLWVSLQTNKSDFPKLFLSFFGVNYAMKVLRLCYTLSGLVHFELHGSTTITRRTSIFAPLMLCYVCLLLVGGFVTNGQTNIAVDEANFKGLNLFGFPTQSQGLFVSKFLSGDSGVGDAIYKITFNMIYPIVRYFPLLKTSDNKGQRNIRSTRIDDPSTPYQILASKLLVNNETKFSDVRSDYIDLFFDSSLDTANNQFKMFN